ncbi:hypothetical protein GCM10028806_16030 [Spirosoma terrae]|uniref:Uncharacterized protein n=1 Tax=Spirosoma terrae TaxID=1968276 RepID=A0A6L9L7Y4_9BACT|nr:hypothetical protein [Spirosoma terrae]NDU95251.1 hypothetical protein [Spirosoma terrae]
MKPLTVYQATYLFAPAFGAHVRQAGSDAHPLLTEQIRLEPPLDKQLYPDVHLAATGRTSFRSCLFWAPWYRSTLTDIYFTDELQGDESYVLVWQPQQQQADHITTFRLWLFPVQEDFPRPAQFWRKVQHLLQPP